MCKSAALPATNVGTVELPFRGRVIKVPGDRTYETWTATFYMDDAFELRAAYEKWISLTNGVDANIASADIVQTWKDITISQLDKFGGPGAADSGLTTIREYKLVQAFPVSVSQVSVAYDNNDSFEEFDVEFDSSGLRPNSSIVCEVNLPATVNVDNSQNEKALQIDVNIAQPTLSCIYIIRAY
jgi:hypothetical protein